MNCQVSLSIWSFRFDRNKSTTNLQKGANEDKDAAEEVTFRNAGKAQLSLKRSEQGGWTGNVGRRQFISVVAGSRRSGSSIVLEASRDAGW